MLTEPHFLSVTLPCVDFVYYTTRDRSIYQVNWVAMTQWRIQEFLTGGVGAGSRVPKKAGL